MDQLRSFTLRLPLLRKISSGAGFCPEMAVHLIIREDLKGGPIEVPEAGSR